MDRKAWDRYRALPPGPRKKHALAGLLAEEENLIQYLVSRFVASSRYHTDDLRDDLLQAARIGVLRAIEEWDPQKGTFLTVAWGWSKYEMQVVLEKAAMPITVPRRAHLPKRKQDAIAAHEAKHGRAPDGAELAGMGITDNDMNRAQRAGAMFTGLHDDVAVDPDGDGESMEDAIDRKRDTAALRAFLKGLDKQDQDDFWTGKRPDLVERAKDYVDRRKGVRGR